MKARLVQIEAERRVGQTPLTRHETRIGRDPDADLRVDSARVSRRHATIRALGERHTITDLESSNGTTVNGVPVRDAVLLQPGDRIVLGDEVSFVYEESAAPSRRGLLAVLALGLVLLLAVGGSGAIWWWRAHRVDADLQQAVVLADEAVRAARAGDKVTAKERLKSAAGILYRSGHLDAYSRADVPREAMAMLNEHLDASVDLWTLYNDVLRTPRPDVPTRSRRGACRLDQVSARDFEACLSERIEQVLVGLRQDPDDVPDRFKREVAERLRREHTFLQKSLERGEPLIPMLREELEAAKMPPLLHYLALIESGYKNSAVSPAKAAGLWQFMPATARQYGLRVGGGVDERRDNVKSTQAAARYLRDLAFEFGGDALLLALAGYNRGENGVRRALKRLDDPFSDRSYWKLVEKNLLPEETAQYVPRFMAAAVAGEAGLPSPQVLAAAGY
ncbi:MAG: transglycosylase SLT domain-containing protein [Myxococcales bacterium]|nr:transglycosylase SLT domain-containing protein [Myxococcales bacterium]